MSRSGYSDDLENWDLIRWRGRVTSAIRGKRGQKFLIALRDALQKLPNKRLVKDAVVSNGEVCAIGALVAQQDGFIDAYALEVENDTIAESLATRFDIAECLVQEVMYENDESHYWGKPEDRYVRMLKWVNDLIKVSEPPQETEKA